MIKKILVALGVFAAIAGLVGYQYWLQLQSALPPGIASGNGRVEAKQVDIAAREPLRVKEILVKEGDLTERNQVLVRMDTSTLDAQLAEANASRAAAEERVAAAKSGVVRQQSLAANARIEEQRLKKLLESQAASESEYDLAKTAAEASEAAVEENKAKLRTAEQEVLVADANIRTIQTRIDDAVLKSPVRGRVLYKLAEEGETLGAGGKALTLINLEDVYMEIFLPSADAMKLQIGAEARLTADHTPGRCVKGLVSFVSPEAQFTPKQVETKSERDKLMFRVKIQVPEELVKAYIERVKTGVRGMGYVQVDPSAKWPAFLSEPVGPPPQLPPAEPTNTSVPETSSEASSASKTTSP